MLTRSRRAASVIALAALFTVVAAAPASADVLQQPDLQVRKSGGSYLGNNVYNLDGAGQTIATKLKRKKTKTFEIQVHNDGVLPDTVQLAALPTFPGYKVKYFAGAVDITAALLAGTYETPQLLPLALNNHVIRVDVRAQRSAFLPLTIAVTGFSVLLSADIDLVRVNITPR